MNRWRWFRNLRLEDFLGPLPARADDSEPAEQAPDRRAKQAELLALQRLGRSPV